jgi:hypothetical protein
MKISNIYMLVYSQLRKALADPKAGYIRALKTHPKALHGNSKIIYV